MSKQNEQNEQNEHYANRANRAKQTVIGIDGSRAFLRDRTGIEEYAYQVISHLRQAIPCHFEVVLYIKDGQLERMRQEKFILPHNWSVREIRRKRLWTQIGLSREMYRGSVDVLFVPAHTIPLIHPGRSIVTIHGLEYEVCPQAYSWWERFYMRVSIQRSCRWAHRVIAVSENTKKDLGRLYRVKPEKIRVVYEGFSSFSRNNAFTAEVPERLLGLTDRPYILFIGRLEERKNITRMVKAYEMLRKRYGTSHRFILAGKPGYGYGAVAQVIKKSAYTADIVELGYVSEEEKWHLYKQADMVWFITLYEGFGLPVLEAQSCGVPVITSSTSSLPEVAGKGALLADPQHPEEIALQASRLLENSREPGLRAELTGLGYKNLERFGWEQCVKEITDILLESA